MTAASPTAHVRGVRPATLMAGLAWVVCVGMLALLLEQFAYQVLHPAPAKRLLLAQDIPLPSGYIPITLHQSASGADQQISLAPGTTQQFDKFDFQALDPQRHLLFIAHTGAPTEKLSAAGIKVDAQLNGHIIVFNTLQDKVVARVNVPHITGIVVTPDLHKVFAANGSDNLIYAIDETTLTFVPIQLDQSELPDAVAYDQPDHRIVVSDPGLNPETQDVTIIDARSTKVIAKVNIGRLPVLPVERTPVDAAHIKRAERGEGPQFGFDVGHSRYDSVSRRVYVTTQILASPASQPGGPPNPAGAGELVAIDPIAATIVQRLVLPPTCGTPHGLTLDSQQRLAFVACTAFDSNHALTANLLRVDLSTMRAIAADPARLRLEAGADIVVLDAAAHLVLVGCKSVVTVFSEEPGRFRLLGEYLLGRGSHTIAVDEATQEIYLPLVEVGGRPTLRIIRYNANGI